MVLNVEPSVLLCTESVCVRAPQDVDGGRSITTLPRLRFEPRSAWSHCGKALFALSQ